MNLVTGATGLVGAHVALHLLMHNKPVVALKRDTSDLAAIEKLFSFYTPDHSSLFNKIIWREADLNDVIGLQNAMKDIETVYHCAGLVSLDDRDEEHLFKINREGTANIVNVSLEFGLKAFCHVSSIATLQNPEITNNINESVIWKPGAYKNSYALSKYLGEQEVWRGIEEGLNAVIVNPGVILGPGFWHKGTGELFSRSFKGIKFYTEGTTGFIAAEDVSRIMISLTEQKKFGERFVLVEDNYSYKEILEKIHSGLGKPHPNAKAGSFLLNFARIFGKFIPGQVNVTKAVINSLLSSNHYSNLKLKEQLRYEFVGINNCISFTCKAYLNDKTLV